MSKGRDLLQDFIAEVAELFVNPVWVLITLCACCEGFVLSGFAAFLPKFLEAQINLTPADSSMYLGAVFIVFGALGELAGGKDR